MAAKYTITKGESAKDVAHKFTGDPNRDVDMMPLNPHLKTVTGQMGRPAFDPFDWHDGLTVKIPDRWAERGQMHGPAPRGSVGASVINTSRDAVAYKEDLLKKERVVKKEGGWSPRRLFNPNARAVSPFQQARMTGYVGQGDDQGPELPCSYDQVTAKPYYLKVLSGDYPEKNAKEWLGGAWTSGKGPLTTAQLLRANYDKAGGFVERGPYQNCEPKYWNAGDIIKIPANWPAPPQSLVDDGRIVNADGTIYTPDGTSPDEPKVGGDTGIDRVNWTGDGEGGGLVLFVLAAAAAVGGGILLYNANKKKR